MLTKIELFELLTRLRAGRTAWRHTAIKQEMPEELRAHSAKALAVLEGSRLISSKVNKLSLAVGRFSKEYEITEAGRLVTFNEFCVFRFIKDLV